MDPIPRHPSVMASCLEGVKKGQNSEGTEYWDRVQEITSTTPKLTFSAGPDVSTLLNGLQRHRLLDAVRQRPKGDSKWLDKRKRGNKLHNIRKFDEAVKAYNKSICLAETGSKDLGLVYADRSSLCFEEGECEMTLVNIELAKKNNYPVEKLHYLKNREKNCKKILRGNRPNEAVVQRRMAINVEVNPKIPFVAKGIYMQEKPETGYGLWTARDFKTGDVILHERTLITNVDRETKYSVCSFCHAKEGMVSRLLIPCPECTMCMYCSEECMTNGWYYFHRFECDVAKKIEYVSGGSSMFGVRMFFYELTSFGDDLDKMMKHHEDSKRPRRDPLSVEYTEDGRLKNATDFYDVMFRKTPRTTPEQRYMANVFAAAASLCFMQYYFVQFHAANRRVTKFMLDTVKHYTQLCFHHSYKSCHYAISSICKSSGDPNVSKVAQNGHVKLIALRPIRKDEEILASN